MRRAAVQLRDDARARVAAAAATFYRQGHSLATIAAELAISPAFVRTLLAEIGEPLRRRGRPAADTCRRGHPFTDDNTIWQRCGRGEKRVRRCKTCATRRARD